MTYEQFNSFIVHLSQLAREEVPPFPIIKDLFDFIDIRKDGALDMNEWMHSFRIIEVSLICLRRNQLISNRAQSLVKSQKSRERMLM